MNNKALSYGPIEMGIFFVLFIVVFSAIVFYIVKEDRLQEEEKQFNISVSLYWYCVNGCSYMQEVLLDGIQYNNDTKRDQHMTCADKCYDSIPYFLKRPSVLIED